MFLDEYGHNMESEVLVPLSGLVGRDTQVVLAGDPHQLGPVIKNPQCLSFYSLFKNCGLGHILSLSPPPPDHHSLCVFHAAR
ncbi:putative helicase mov-10-B.1 [Portunus trituberculatus]|uniref:putative helicase mov-10-B.1 n=1 Tax=Portunus trituberculatus TaxID=210409 RepID=UPI001E1CC1CA|nr:putative helicase mov-10-B.1 [Portunus trituberculatus]